MPYYAGDNNSHVDILRDVLMTYMMYDFDLGYVQVGRLNSYSYTLMDSVKD